MKLEEALKSNKFEDESHKAGLNVLYSAYWLKTQFTEAFKENGLTTEQFNVLRILKGKHPQKMCVKDIGSRMIEQNSNVPRIIDRLLLKNFVLRTTSPEDKRETLISLTEDGLKHLEIASAITEQVRKDIFGLDEQEAHQLNLLLEKMRSKSIM